MRSLRFKSRVPVNAKELDEVKSIAKQLVSQLQEILVIDWSKNQSTWSLIEEALDEVSESFNEALWRKRCTEVFKHLYEKYPARGQST